MSGVPAPATSGTSRKARRILQKERMMMFVRVEDLGFAEVRGEVAGEERIGLRRGPRAGEMVGVLRAFRRNARDGEGELDLRIGGTQLGGFRDEGVTIEPRIHVGLPERFGE